MTEIIRSLIKWAEENKIFPSIYFKMYEGGVYCVVRLEKDNKAISHMFYIAGGCLTLENWDRFPMDAEVKCFIKEAKHELLGEDTPEPVNCCEDRSSVLCRDCAKVVECVEHMSTNPEKWNCLGFLGKENKL